MLGTGDGWTVATVLEKKDNKESQLTGEFSSTEVFSNYTTQYSRLSESLAKSVRFIVSLATHYTGDAQ